MRTGILKDICGYGRAFPHFRNRCEQFLSSFEQGQTRIFHIHVMMYSFTNEDTHFRKLKRAHQEAYNDTKKGKDVSNTIYIRLTIHASRHLDIHYCTEYYRSRFRFSFVPFGCSFSFISDSGRRIHMSNTRSATHRMSMFDVSSIFDDFLPEYSRNILTMWKRVCNASTI